MSFIPVTASGRLHDALVRNAHVTYVNCSSPQDTKKEDAAIGEKATFSSVEGLATDVISLVREGKAKTINAPDGQSVWGVQDEYRSSPEGKTIVDNRSSIGFIVGSIFGEDGQLITTPEDANISASMGAATHGFFYHKTDFLMDAAKKYATLGENEVFQYRDINDINFVRDTLDFFTNGNYTNEDVKSMQEQITAVVSELAQQIKNGKSPDLSKLQSKLTIGGTDVTVSELMDLQKVGGDLKDSFSDVFVGTNHSGRFAQIGISKAMGTYYGDGKGKIGEMFSSAIDRLAQKNLNQIQKAFRDTTEFGWQFGGHNAKMSTYEKEGMEIGFIIADMFSGLDTSSKDSLSKDFTSKLSEMRSMLQQYAEKHGVLTSQFGLAGDTADITKHFQAWMDKI